jgi:hypothetical protein
MALTSTISFSIKILSTAIRLGERMEPCRVYDIATWKPMLVVANAAPRLDHEVPPSIDSPCESAVKPNRTAGRFPASGIGHGFAWCR